ncbi:MAG: phosphoribosylformylglycinamidine synthase [Clostridia bacterium]|nr:phosphoribosylformylglycinamidine synthase [Clostridia bacterium]
MVYRVYVEKKPAFRQEADALLSELRELPETAGISGVRIVNRYDAENISAEMFERAVGSVFSEPQVDDVYTQLPFTDEYVFAVEYLPGQFDQRADSAAQCIQIISCTERPYIRSAKVYALSGSLSESGIAEIKKYLINPVEAREAELALPDTIIVHADAPADVPVLSGFRALDENGRRELISTLGLAMDEADVEFCRAYFEREGRDPTLTELRVIDTYWSDHCRHTTFLTRIDRVKTNDPLLKSAYNDYLAVRRELGRDKPVTLMDIGTLAAKYLKAKGELEGLDESDEINACTVKTSIEIDGKNVPYLLLFKNETHNHPTEIEPFGGAATCIGGAIRDPLSGRGYVYGAMRVTGAADPTAAISETLPGKLPQRKIVTTAAAGYSSYGNQIGLATGLVDEVYHPGYAAKRMEIGAVLGAVPEANVVRETPQPGDAVILLGGRTGRDGIGGATGSSKAHNARSVETSGAEVQKGNAPEERKLQRLFRNPEACRLIKRCNDFGAGGVSVAIGELADGLTVDLDKVPLKYEGLSGTEIAISESQERMAVVVARVDAQKFMRLAQEENLEATLVALVTEEPRLVMTYNGSTIVDLKREFLASNGAEKHISVAPAPTADTKQIVKGTFAENLRKTVSDLNVCSKRGLSERFDSTIGAGSVFMPFGGKNQLTPTQALAMKIPLESGKTDDVSLMAYGFDPYLSERSPYHGAYAAVVESVCRLIASGAEFKNVYLSFQEYFPKPGSDPARWGLPFAALLGAFEAQIRLGVAAIGGKDSMSGTFEKLDVPPTLVSFAVTMAKAQQLVTPEFKRAGDKVYLLRCDTDENGLADAESLKRVFVQISVLSRKGALCACAVPGMGGAAAQTVKMAFGNGFGFRFADPLSVQTLFERRTGAFIIEADEQPAGALELGTITDSGLFELGGESVSAAEVLALYENRLENVFRCNIPSAGHAENVTYKASARPAPAVKTAQPTVLIPVFPGTSCEYDSARAVNAAGARANVFVIINLSAEGVMRSTERFARALGEAQAVFIPGGFSGGDEPDGSGKFITAFFRNPEIKHRVGELLDVRGGLMLGICNGFQALIKLGLVPFGKIVDTDAECPTLTFNTIGRHQSRIVRTRVASTLSPWLSLMQPGDIVNVPISHGEGRFVASDGLMKQLIARGQIATQYVDLDGSATMDVHFNPNGSLMAVEGITSPDGRVLGKMGHSERVGAGLYKNVPGNYDIRLFEAAVKYFKA